MIEIRQACKRGHTNHGWLDSWHSFSFANYFDPQHMGFSVLRAINDDRIAPKAGFPTHGHRDMEIITYLLQGTLEHKDSMGNGSVIRPGEAQRMSAGSGVKHSEFNASDSEVTHLLQIWIEPKERGITPSYEQKSVAVAGICSPLNLLASPDGRQGSVTIHQDVFLYVVFLQEHEEISYSLPAGRRGYIHMTKGKLKLNGFELKTGDGAKIWGENINILSTTASSEALIFDLP